MVSADMCRHDWPGSGCRECEAEQAEKLAAQHTIGEKAEFLRAGGYTRRYHGWRTLMDDPVGIHSFNVVNILLLIRPNASRELIIACIRHDGAEWVTGDPPSTAKRAVPGLKEAMDGYERATWLGAGFSAPTADLTAKEKLELKLADYLDGMMYCAQELAMGNRLIIPVYKVFYGYMVERLTDQPMGPEHELFNHISAFWHTLGGPYVG